MRVLIELLRTEDVYEELGEIAFALVKTDKPVAIDALIKAINGNLEKGEMVGIVQKIDALTLSPNPRAYSWAIDTLGKKSPIGHAWVVRALAVGQCYGDIWLSSMDTGPERRAQALKDPRIVEPLMALVDTLNIDSTTRANAILALRKTEDPGAMEFLKMIEGDETPTAQAAEQ